MRVTRVMCDSSNPQHNSSVLHEDRQCRSLGLTESLEVRHTPQADEPAPQKRLVILPRIRRPGRGWIVYISMIRPVNRFDLPGCKSIVVTTLIRKDKVLVGNLPKSAIRSRTPSRRCPDSCHPNDLETIDPNRYVVTTGY